MLLDMMDGTDQQFNGIAVQRVYRNQANQLMFTIAERPGAEGFDIEVSRIKNLAFGLNGGDAYFDLTLNINGQNREFPGSNMQLYSNGNFTGIPPGQIAPDTIPASSVIEMVPGFAQVATPPPLAPPTNQPLTPPVQNNDPASFDPFASGGGSPAEQFDNSPSDFLPSSNDESLQSGDTFVSDEDYYLDEDEFGSLGGGFGAQSRTAIVLQGIASIITIITLIILIAHAVGEGEGTSALFIFCCWPYKVYYALAKFNTSLKIPVIIAIFLEFIISFAAGFIDVW